MHMLLCYFLLMHLSLILSSSAPISTPPRCYPEHVCLLKCYGFLGTHILHNFKPFLTLSILIKSLNYWEARQYTHWQQAKTKDRRVLQLMHTWGFIISFPPEKTTITCKCVYNVKT